MDEAADHYIMRQISKTAHWNTKSVIDPIAIVWVEWPKLVRGVSQKITLKSGAGYKTDIVPSMQEGPFLILWGKWQWVCYNI